MNKIILLLLISLLCAPASYSQVSINHDGSAPDSSALLDLKSTEKGLLAPRMTASQMFSIQNPATGLIVYNTTTTGVFPAIYVPGYYYWDGNIWIPMSRSSGLNVVPALTQSQIDSLPAIAGTIVLNTYTGCLNYYSGTAWMAVCGTSTSTPVADLMFAPYVDCLLWPNFQIQNTSATGIFYYSCAFIVDDQSATGANPCWGGYPTLGMDYYQSNILALRTQGGDIIMSFGGASGVELAYAAANEFLARDAYKTVIDAYDLSSIDFDIEGMFIADSSSVSRRSKAMKLLQDEYPGLKISITLPVMTDGLTVNGLNVLQSAIDEDVDIYCVNLMAMDYGPPGIDMGNAAIAAGEAVFLQLKTLYQGSGINLPDTAVWKKIGLTPMIGQNDIQGEVFYLDDASDLTAWAVEKNINRLSMWSVNRDRECLNPYDPLYSCSHIPQVTYEFSGIFGTGTVTQMLYSGSKATKKQIPANPDLKKRDHSH